MMTVLTALNWNFSTEISQKIKAGEVEAVVVACQSKLDKAPDDLQAILTLARLILEHSNSPKKAQALAEHGLAERPKEALFWVLLGQAHQQQQQLPEALKAYTQALQLNAACKPAYFFMASLLEQQGYGDEALEAYYQATQLEDATVEDFLQLAQACQRQNAWPEAAETYQKALQLEPYNGMLHFLRGAAWEKAGDNTKAQAAYAEALETSPDLAGLHLEMGRYFASQPQSLEIESGLAEKAVKHYVECLALLESASGPEEKTTPTLELGYFLYNLGRKDDTVALLEAFLPQLSAQQQANTPELAKLLIKAQLKSS